MTKTQIGLFALALAVVAGIWLSQPEHKFIGKWSLMNGLSSETIEITASEAIYTTPTKGPMAYPYRLTNNGQNIVIEMGRTEFFCAIENDVLVARGPLSTVYRYRRF